MRTLSSIGVIDLASNGQEAYECVRENESSMSERKYDMIFIDLEMPIKNGYQACAIIKQHYKLL